MISLSTFRPSKITPTIELQAGIRLACGGTSALVGLTYFTWTISHLKDTVLPKLSPKSFKILAFAGAPFFLESAIRNALYRYQTSTIISFSADYATARGIFNTIRWGLVMVPVNTLAATSEVFVGRRYGLWNATRDGLQSWPSLLCLELLLPLASRQSCASY